MDQDDVQEMVRAYQADKLLFHKIDLTAVCGVATGRGADRPPLVKGQIASWLGTQIFAIAPPGSAKPLDLLYTVTTYQHQNR